MSNHHKSTALAMGMSIIPGSGTMYAGAVRTGACILGAFLFFVFVTVSGLASIPLAVWLLLWAVAIGSAGGQAQVTNHRHRRELY